MAQRSVFTSLRQVSVTNLKQSVVRRVAELVLSGWNCLAVRENWHQEDPQLISEVLFAVTSMLSFTRLAYILPAHESLGTLQISIGKMIDDMMRCEQFQLTSCSRCWLKPIKASFFRFMFILMIIGTAFLCGINNVYVPYVISPHLGR